MNFFKQDYTIEKTLNNIPTPQQVSLKKYADKDFTKREAKYLWERIVDHKWYMSERLKRDIGFRVAAIDYVENFYEPVFYETPKTNFKDSLRQFFKTVVRTEFLRPKSL